MMKIVPNVVSEAAWHAADARNRLSDLVDSVDRTHDRVVITRHGKSAAVLMAPDDLEALEETIDVLASAEAMRQLAASREDRKRGDVLDQAELAELMRKPNYS